MLSWVAPPDAATIAQRKIKAYDCPCPFLRTAYVQGLLKPDEQGYVTLADCYRLMKWAGVGTVVFPPNPYYEKFAISGVPLLHLALNRPNDTGALHKDVSEEERRARLDKFLSFADKDGNLGPREIQAALDYNVKMKGGNDVFMTNTQGEMVAILSVFGRRRSCFFWQNYITKDDVEALWWRFEWPEGWLKRRTPEGNGITSIDFSMGVRIALFKYYAEKGITKDPMPKAIAPWSDAPIAPSPDEPKPTAADEAQVFGGKFSNPWDSRMGGLQPVVDGWMWQREVYEKTPSLWQLQTPYFATDPVTYLLNSIFSLAASRE